MNFDLKIGFFDLIALFLSTIALIATLRKKEFGKFVYIELNSNRKEREFWIKLIKSNVYDVEFTIISKDGFTGRFKLEKMNENGVPFWFPDDTNKKMNIAMLSENDKIIINCSEFEKIEIRFKDRFENRYFQTIKNKSCSNRRHINFWNLTFVGA